jgi:hypothetical protein
MHVMCTSRHLTLSSPFPNQTFATLTQQQLPEAQEIYAPTFSEEMADVGAVGDAVPEGAVAAEAAEAAWAEAVEGVVPVPAPEGGEEEEESEPEEEEKEQTVVKGKGGGKKKKGPKVKETPSRRSTRSPATAAVIKSAATPTPKRVRALPSVKVPPSSTSKASKKAAPVSRKAPKKKGAQSEAGKVIAKSKRK